MVILLGALLVGTHFLILVLVSQLCAIALPDYGLIVFLTVAVQSGMLMLRIQTQLERFFIRRHLAKYPNSGWRVVADNGIRETRMEPDPAPSRGEGPVARTLKEKLRFLSKMFHRAATPAAPARLKRG